MQIVSRSRGIAALSRRGGTGFSPRTCLQRLHRRRCLERRAAGHERVQGRTERIHIGSGADLGAVPPGLLWRHVAGRPHDLARARQPAVELQILHQTEIRDPWVAVPIQEDVARFQVTMDHTPAVSVLNRLSHLGHQRGCIARRQGPLGQTLREALALDKGHGEIMLAVVLADLKDPHNPRMVEVGGRLASM